LVLILIYIALATILHFKEHEAQKLLPMFVIIALLVNFTPVFCGLIVDASNIVMNFFVKDLEADAFGSLMSGNIDQLYNAYSDANKDTAIIYLSQMVVMFPVLGILGFVLLIFAFIFLFRYIAIWMLVILSPLAFISLILPKTKKYWTMWWEQFIRWSFIGATAGFFLYLGLYLSSMTSNSTVTFSNPATGNGTLFDQIIPYFVSIAFLGAGVIFGLKTSAMGASTIINFAKAGVKKPIAWTAKKTWKGLNVPERKIWRDKEGKSVTMRDIIGKATDTWDKVPIARWFRPEPLKKFSEYENRVEALKKEITGPSPIEAEKLADGKYTGSKAAAALDAIAKDRGDSQDIIKAYIKKYNVKSEEELLNDQRFLSDKTLINALGILRKSGKRGKVERIHPRLSLIGRSKKEGIEKMRERVIDAKPGDIASMEREVADNEMFMEMALALKDEGHFRTMAGLKGGAAARQHVINKIFSKWVKKSKLDPKNNKDNAKKYWGYLSKKYNVITPGGKKAFGNPRMKSLGFEENPQFIDEQHWAVTPGSSSKSDESEEIKSPSAASAIGWEIEKLKSLKEKNKERKLKSISEKIKEEKKLERILEKRKRKKK